MAVILEERPDEVLAVARYPYDFIDPQARDETTEAYFTRVQTAFGSLRDIFVAEGGDFVISSILITHGGRSWTGRPDPAADIEIYAADQVISSVRIPTLTPTGTYQYGTTSDPIQIVINSEIEEKISMRIYGTDAGIVIIGHELTESVDDADRFTELSQALPRHVSSTGGLT